MNCKYSPNINPQVTIEYIIALRFFHYFIRDSWGFYEAGIFKNQNGIRGNRIQNVSIHDILDNMDLFVNNKCGLAHGLLDSSWNIAALGPIVHCDFFAKSASERGVDLRAYDNEFARTVGEPSYCEMLKFFGDFNGSCDGNIRVEDFPHMDGNMLKKLITRFGSIGKIGLTLGLDVEHRAGEIFKLL